MLPTMPFGKTGHLSTRTLFGAAAFSNVSQDDADRTMEFVLEKGINHIDTAADYGLAEERLGPWMARHRDRFFLATKTGDRTYDGARESLHRSLDRMKTDYVDLIQMHVLVKQDEWDTAVGARGALEYLVEAKESGLTRFIGVTGHGLAVARMHMNSLDRYPFDSVLLPWNYPMSCNPDYRREFGMLRDRCAREGVAVQTIKSIARGPWGDKPKTRSVWYEPLEDQADIDLAVAWVLGDATLFLNTAGDINLLPRVIEAAEKCAGEPIPDGRMDDLVRRRGLEPLFVE